MKDDIPLQQVQDAIDTLQSIGLLGLQNLCHETDGSWEPVLPLCSHDVSSSHYYLRGGGGAAGNDFHQHRFLEEQQFNSMQEEEKYYIYNITGTIICVGSVALVAGLFLGLLTLDALDLRIIERASIDEDEKAYAAILLPIVENRHQLLVTLLLLNALAYETLPIFLDALVPSWMAILLSTTLIMFFGEILPSGIFTGPQQLYLGSKLAPLTRFFLWIMYPFAKPLALMLDYLVKDEDGTGEGYNRGELSALVRIQYEDAAPVGTTRKKVVKRRRFLKEDTWHACKQEIIEKVNELYDTEEFEYYGEEKQPSEPPVEQLVPPLDKAEVDLIEGALQMKTLLAMDVFTPLSQMYAVPEDLVLDRKGFTEIYRQGYSRVPVYRRKRDESEYDEDKTNILGFLMVKQLILIDWDHEREVSTLPLQRPSCVSPRMNLVDLMRILRSRGYLMSFVCARPDLANKALDAEKPIPVEAGFMGIVTLQDVMESMLQERIYDEWDIKDRDRAVATLQRWAATKLQSFVRKKVVQKKREQPKLHKDDPTHSNDENAPLLSNIQNGCYSSV